jgi:hypothetical protein
MALLLSKTEQAYLANKEQFSKTKQRYLRYRIRKKLNRSRDAAAATSRDGVELITTTRPFGHDEGNSSNDIIISTSHSNTERGSPRPARAGSNLVGRGIANPMSERTRGFEMLLTKGSTSIPLPALIFSFFSLIIIIMIRNPRPTRLLPFCSS